MKHRIKKLVEHLRTKPEKERQHIALVATTVVGVVLVFVWIAVFTAQSKEPKQKKEVFGENIVQPFELLKKNFNTTVDTVSQGVSGFTEDLKSITQETSTETMGTETASTEALETTQVVE
ncbi:MAG: hypothetical protein MUD00_02330 [Candidatus Pacebacteria bacterium]|jgi:hypothetical protein|nr:hypothetical protein [Candidatus Paceibacterota bacterium]